MKQITRIKEKMNQHDLSRNDVRDYFVGKCEVTPSLPAIDKWISGENKPKREHLAILARLFKTTTDYLNYSTDIDAPSFDVEMLMSALGLSKDSLQVLYNAQHSYLLNQQMTAGRGFIVNVDDVRLLRVVNALLGSKTGRELITILYKTLFEQNRIFLNNVEEMYRDNPSIWTAEQYQKEYDLAVKRGHKVSEIFLLEKVNELRESLKGGNGNG